MNKKPPQKLSSTYARSGAPLYVQVAAELRGRIQSGLWKLGDKISTQEELEQEFQVARITVRQAVDLLQQDGLVQRRQGKGTFVTGAPPDTRWLKLSTQWESLIAGIKDNVTHVLPVVGPPPPPPIQAGDGRSADDYVFIKSLQTRQGHPYALARVHVHRPIFERHRKRFLSETALSVLAAQESAQVARAHQTFVIGAADMEIAQALSLALNAPTAEARCVVAGHDDLVIYAGQIVYRGDCVKFDIDLLDAPNG